MTLSVTWNGYTSIEDRERRHWVLRTEYRLRCRQLDLHGGPRHWLPSRHWATELKIVWLVSFLIRLVVMRLTLCASEPNVAKSESAEDWKINLAHRLHVRHEWAWIAFASWHFLLIGFGDFFNHRDFFKDFLFVSLSILFLLTHHSFDLLDVCLLQSQTMDNPTRWVELVEAALFRDASFIKDDNLVGLREELYYKSCQLSW